MQAYKVIYILRDCTSIGRNIYNILCCQYDNMHNPKTEDFAVLDESTNMLSARDNFYAILRIEKTLANEFLLTARQIRNV